MADVSRASEAWEPTPADIEEAFLLWATPRVQFHGAAQEEAYSLMMADTVETAKVLPRLMGTPSGSVRDKILTLTEELGAGAVGPAFRPHAGADSPHLSLVMFCLSRAKDLESLPILAGHLRHDRAQMRSIAALSLGYLGHPDAVADLVRVINSDTESSVRKSAAFAIGQCADSTTVGEEALDALIRTLDDPFFAARFNAARALARLADPAARRLSDKYDGLSDTARYGALFASGRMKDAVSVNLLDRIAADTSARPELRGIALRGLIERKHPIADTDLQDLRAMPIGRGLWGLIR
ncbi:HEAT repeat domain-containing protein [bacterium]|nr:HEAT repeat domain-containing protein [bacterium]